jgi:RNA polymerase sigma factor (TIGR02999 family)
VPENDPKGVTQLLIDLGNGDERVIDQMLPLVYDELRRLAGHYIGRERSGHTLQPTALLHEAYLRLIDQRRVDWKNRAQFFGLAAQMMRRVLSNYARDRAAGKRGGGAQKVTLSMAEGVFDQPAVDVLALDEALDELAKFDERKCRIIELKFFTGLTNEEIAQTLSISTATVEREWTLARAWLYNALKSADNRSGSGG